MHQPSRTAAVRALPRRAMRRLLLAAVLLAGVPLLAPAAPVAMDATQPAFWHGTAADGTPSIRLYFFWTPTCPHCRAARPFVAALPERLPWVEIVSLPVNDDPASARLYYETARALGVEALSVPGFMYCRRVEIGYDAAATTGEHLVRQLRQCREQLLADPAAVGAPTRPAGTGPAAGNVPATRATGGDTGAADADVTVPFLGRVGATTWSLPVLTAVLALVDAFNPCAFFVLLFLLSILVHARQRSRMLLVGGTFVLISGLAYFAFMAAWLNIFLIAGELRLVTLAAGVLALVIGALNVKDYFRFQEGPSLSIPAGAKPGLFRRMRAIAAAGRPGPMLASTVLLAPALLANAFASLLVLGAALAAALLTGSLAKRGGGAGSGTGPARRAR